MKSRGIVCIQNSLMQLQAYKYNTLYTNTSSSSASVKPDWEATLGELALSIDVYQQPDEVQIVVGCEQHVYVVKAASGKIEHLKKLQCVPSAVMVNPFKTDTKEMNLIVSSFSHHILFYKNFELVWATKYA